jgi:hypothetical protein
VRSQIRFMGGDLLEPTSPLGQTQHEWFNAPQAGTEVTPR